VTFASSLKFQHVKSRACGLL